jgi:hypothetical protein
MHGVHERSLGLHATVRQRSWPVHAFMFDAAAVSTRIFLVLRNGVTNPVSFTFGDDACGVGSSWIRSPLLPLQRKGRSGKPTCSTT